MAPPPANQAQLIQARQQGIPIGYDPATGAYTPRTAPAAAAPGAPGQPNVPLDPAYEAQRRAIEDALAAELSSIGVQRDQIPALTNLFMTRLATQQGESTRQINEGAAARGIYHSGIRPTDIARSDLGYERERQDYAMSVVQQQQQLAAQEAAARAADQGGLAEALLALAERNRETYAPPGEGEVRDVTGGMAPSLEQQAPKPHDHGHGGPNTRNHHGQRHDRMHSHAHKHA